MANSKTIQSQGSAVKGILGKKLGMTQVFDANNKIVPVTVVEKINEPRYLSLIHI